MPLKKALWLLLENGLKEQHLEAENPGRRPGNSPSEKAMARMEMERNGQMRETAGNETDTPR